MVIDLGPTVKEKNINYYGYDGVWFMYEVYVWSIKLPRAASRIFLRLLENRFVIKVNKTPRVPKKEKKKESIIFFIQF